MSDVLARIDNSLANLCPCGADPRPGSPYCGPDCEPTHIAVHTDTRTTGDYATPMRWRPDLVTAADDTDLIPLGSDTCGYTGRYNAQIFERATDPTIWHLRLDDGHRYVGCDVPDMGGRQDPISVDMLARVRDGWKRLERELGNPNHTVPVERRSYDEWRDVLRWLGQRIDAAALPEDPWADIWPATRWAFANPPYQWQRRCRTCGQYGEPRHGRRPAHTTRPAALTNSLNGEPTEADCQVCAHCGTAFPGPPITYSARIDHQTDTWRFQLRTDYCTVRENVSAEDIARMPDQQAGIQQVIDRIEARALTPPLDLRRFAGSLAAIRFQPTRMPALPHLPAPPPTVTLGLVPESQMEILRHSYEHAFAGLSSAIQEVWRRYQPALAHVAEVTGQEDSPPSDPMARALWLRRNRNTGPAAPPLDPRRRRR
ncbi:hypothetical protein ABZ949_02435 [Micromonospora tulbaghiae]|uniref:hypothetical protein n=1 Tax=Micromonospora tulbaghiae TaxID=479978 RepID=UPI0033C91E2C